MSSHTPDEALASSLKALKELNDYGLSILEKVATRGHKLNGRETYLAALYISALAQVRGILRLLDDRQYRASTTLTRTLYEIWVNARFIYSDRNLIYTEFLALQGERKRVSMSRLRRADGDITEAELDEAEKKLAEIERWFGKRRPAWPETILPIINPDKGNPVDRRKEFSLKDRCAIIDHYDQKYHRRSAKHRSMVGHYERLYSHLSGTPHADPNELGSAFKEMDDVIHIDIEGSGNINAMIGLSSAAFVFQFEVIRAVKSQILKERKPNMPGWLELHAKDLGLFG